MNGYFSFFVLESPGQDDSVCMVKDIMNQLYANTNKPKRERWMKFLFNVILSIVARAEPHWYTHTTTAAQIMSVLPKQQEYLWAAFKS